MPGVDSPRNKFSRPGRLLALLSVPLLWCVLERNGVLESTENQTIDLRFHARGEIDAPVKLIYVDIDNDAIQQYKWPWNNARYAQLLDALFDKGRVKAVGFDLVLSQDAMPDFGKTELVAGRVQLGKAVRQHQNVVFAANYVKGPGTFLKTRQFPFIFEGATDPDKNDLPEIPEYPIVGPTYGLIGLIDTYRAETRAVPFFADTPQATYYPLALRLALLHWGLGLDAIKRLPDRIEIRRPEGTLVTSVPLLRGQLAEVNWFSAWSSPKNDRCGIGDIGDNLTLLDSDDPVKQARGREFFAQFNDAIVLVGPVDPLLQDVGRTSFDDVPVPQVGVHGNLLKTLTSGLYLRHLPSGMDDALVVGLALAVCGLAVAGGPKSVRNKLIAVALLVAFVFGALEAFSHWQLVLPMAAPLGAAFTTSFVAVGWQLVAEEKAKGRIKGMFGAYVSPQLVERMIESGEDPQLGGHEAEITAYFSDIQSFSTFSEKLPPARLVELMNEYLTACTDIVQEQGGTLDKYIGDAVVAMFGAPIALPDHALRACVATQLVHRKLGELRGKWRAEGDKWPEIVGQMQTRVGLNSGATIIGNMGSRTRFNYTMMGDNVNLAARMESGAKAYGVYTLTTEATKLACEKHGGDRLVFRYLDKIVVKGRSIPVPIYEIVGLREHVTDETRECLRVFAEGITRYLAQDWDGAEARFRQSAALEPNQPGQTPGVESNPSLTLLRRCDYWRAHPPGAGWDGVYEMKEK